MATKKNIDLELADKFYEGVKEYAAKLEKTRAAIEKNKASISEQYADYDVEALSALENSGVKIEDKDGIISDFKQYSSAAGAVAVLEEQEKKYLENKEILEKNIKTAIAKYITKTEQDITKAQKNVDSYAKYIKEEQEKLSVLEQEIKSLEGNEEQAEVLKDKKEDYEALKIKIEERLKKLEGYNKELEELKLELEKNKEKYKDYLDLASKDLTEPGETTPNGKENTGDNNEPEKGDKSQDGQPSKDDKKEPDSVKKEDNVHVGGTGTPIAGEDEVPEKTGEKEPETDEQAFNRIYKLLSKRKTRDSVTNEDVDKMIEILSNKDNYAKLKIGTKRFLDLGIFPCKAEKIYKQLGKKLSHDAYNVTKNKEVLSATNRDELAKWENVLQLGVKADEKTETEIALDKALETASDKDKEQILAVKSRLTKYRQAMVTLDEVMLEKGELQFVNKELPAAKEEVKEDAAEREQLQGRLIAALENAVNKDVTVPTSKESHEEPSKTEKVVSDSHDAI